MPLKNYNSSAFANSTITGWTQVGATNEWYKNTDYKHKPLLVLENGTALAEGTVGALAAANWGWGDPATLGFNTIVVHCTGDADPATKTMTATIAETLATAAAGHSIGIMSIEMQSDEPSDAKNVKLIRTDSSDVEFFVSTISIPALDTVILDHAIVLAEGEKFKFMAASQIVGIVLNANDITN